MDLTLKGSHKESVRLWPTTPLLLRESTADTQWDSGMLPADTAIVIFAPFFHRDDERLPYADRFAPELWQNGAPPPDAAIVPFSEGPATCAGRARLMLTSATISSLLSHARLRLLPGSPLKPRQPIPDTLSHFRLRFELRPLAH
jgi:cytochrome P450